MLVPILSLATLLIATFIVFCVLLPLKKIHSYKQPGVSTYFFPLLGHINYIEKGLKEKGDTWGFSKEPRKHGSNPKFLATHFGRTPLFVLEDPKYVKEFLLKPNLYRKSPLMDSMKPLAGTGLVLAEGETWKRHRKIISSSFNFEFLKSNMELIQNTTKEFFGKLTPEELKNYSAISKVQEITGEIVGRIFFGENLNSYTFEGKSLTLALAELTSEMALAGGTISFVIFGPKIFEIPFFPKYTKLMQRVTNFRRLCFNIIQDRKSKTDVQANDLLSCLLETQKSEDVEKRFSDEDIVNEFVTFFVAGMDTTGHLIGMTIYNLSQYPEYLAQLQEERNKTYNDKEQPLTTDTLTKMELLHAILKESLRFYTPAPFIFYREVLQDHDLLDIKLKKGDLIVPDLLSASWEERNFENAKQFNPERWLNPETKTDPYAFVPFSAGPRNCIGQHLALMEAKVILCEFLERFDFSLKEGYKLKMSFTFLYEPEQEMKFTLKPKITA